MAVAPWRSPGHIQLATIFSFGATSDYHFNPSLSLHLKIIVLNLEHSALICTGLLRYSLFIASVATRVNWYCPFPVKVTVFWPELPVSCVELMESIRTLCALGADQVNTR